MFPPSKVFPPYGTLITTNVAKCHLSSQELNNDSMKLRPAAELFVDVILILIGYLLVDINDR